MAGAVKQSKYIKLKEKEKLAPLKQKGGYDVTVTDGKTYLVKKQKTITGPRGMNHIGYADGKNISNYVEVDENGNFLKKSYGPYNKEKVILAQPIDSNFSIGSAQRISNPLHKFVTQNAVFTLAALSLDEVNFPDTTIIKDPPRHVVAKSAGGEARETELMEGGKLEFYIDNVNIEAIVHSNSTTGHTQGTNITFTVHEPFSLGLFLQNLQFKVAEASGTLNKKQMANYLTHPMALVLDFKGQLDGGMALTSTEAKQLRKVMPIQLTKVNFGNSNGISTYDVEAIALNDLAFSDQYATTQHEVTLSGSTVSEILWSGENSLAKHLNFQEAIILPTVYQSTRSVGYVLKDQHGEVVKYGKGYGTNEKYVYQVKSPRDFVFLFPDDVAFSSASIMKGAQPENNKTTVMHDYDEPETVPYVTRVENMFRLIFDDNFSYTEEKGFSGAELNMNEIGKSKFFYKKINLPADKGKVFPDEGTSTEEHYDKENQIFKQGSSKIDEKNKTISFKKGTHIAKMIEEVILNSEYGQNIDARKRNAPEGLISWFKIIPARYIFQDELFKKKYNTHPEILLYRIVPYFVPDDKFLAPNDASRINQLDDFIRKEYNIIYTGKNKDVIDFNVEFNNAFYTGVMNDMGNKTPGNVDNSEKAGESENTVVDTAESTSEVANNNINQSSLPEDVQGEGSDAETPELKIARQFNKAILDSEVDLVKLDLNIVGDPYFLPQSAFGNYIAATNGPPTSESDIDAVRKDTTKVDFEDANSTANFLRSIVLTKVNFRTPLDIRDGDGEYEFYKREEDKTQQLGEFSGYYYPIKVVSSFAGNKFTQEIEMIRNKTGIQGFGTTKTPSEPALKTTTADVHDEISREVSEIAEQGDDGLNPYQA